jgi:hypothetical protein
MPLAGGTSSPAPGVTLANDVPSKSGWHLLQFIDGTVAVVRYDNGAWQWGSQVAPTSNVLSMNWVGGNVTQLSEDLPKFADSIVQNSSFDTWSTLLSSIDHGFLSLGQPIVVDAAGKVPSSGNSPTSQQGSEAVPSGVNIPGVSSIFSVFASLGFWKGIGLVLAGVLIIVFGALELRKLA